MWKPNRLRLNEPCQNSQKVSVPGPEVNPILDLTRYNNKVQRGGKRQNNLKNVNYNQWSGSI